MLLVSGVDANRGLVAHIEAQLSSRTNGSANFTGPTDASNFFSAPPTNTPNFWLRDVTNILSASQYTLYSGGMISSSNYKVPISPRVCVSATHTGTAYGNTNVWLLPDGSYYTNFILSSTTIAGTDIQLNFMATTNWTFVRVLPNATNKVGAWKHPELIASFGFHLLPIVKFHGGVGRTNVFHSSFICGSAGMGSLYSTPGVLFGDYSTGFAWISGDSSSPAFAVINNEAVLVGCAYTAGYAPPLADYVSEINSAIASLCASNAVPAETLSIYDLSQFQNL